MASVYYPVSLLATELRDDFALHADGAPVIAETGQPYLLNGTAGSPSVASGKLTVTPSGQAAYTTYVQIQLAGSGKRIGCRFTFSSNSTTTGNITFGFWAAQIDNSAATPPPDCPGHLVVFPTGWTYSYWSGGTNTVILGGSFATPLAADGTTIHHAEFFLDAKKAQAHVFLPDGTRVTLSNAIFGSVVAPFAFLETNRTLSTDTLGTFTDWWADSQQWAPVAEARRQMLLPARPAALTYGTNNLATPIAQTSTGDIDATNLALTFVPTTAIAFVTFEGTVNISSATNLIWSVRNGTTVLSSCKVYSSFQAATVARLHASFEITGLTAGLPITLKWAALATVSNAATLLSDASSGYNNLMRVESI